MNSAMTSFEHNDKFLFTFLFVYSDDNDRFRLAHSD